MCFELVELYLGNSLFLLKACLCNDGINAENQQGSRWFSHRLFRETYSHPRKYLHFIWFACVSIYIFTCVWALRCPNGGGHGVYALLLPRVYLQTVTLMQCNDYFYSRYFSIPFTLSGMTPHWPTDYLCGCCHTWLLQFSSLSTITPSEPSLFYYCAFICFSLYHSKSLLNFYTLHFYFVCFFLCISTVIISSSLPSINHYTCIPLPYLI